MYPSLAVPTLFSMLTFEFPTLIAYCSRLKDQFILPVVKSPYERPSFYQIAQKLVLNPLAFLFDEKLEATANQASQELIKAERVKRFYNGAFAVVSVLFFALFIQKHEIGFATSANESLEEDE